MSFQGVSAANIVKAHDWDRYIATLFAPEDKRADLLTLYAFDAEISRIRTLISDPLPGEIRLQWWREVITGTRATEALGHLLASEICSVIERHDLPKMAFDTYFDAKTFEYYNDAFPDTNALEAWCGETSSAMFQMAAMILDKDAAKSCADVSGHGGVASAISKILQFLPQTRSRGQCFVPTDLLAACALDRDSFVRGDNKVLVKNVTNALCELGLSHYSKYQIAAKRLRPELKPIFAPVVNSQRVFRRAQMRQVNPAFEPMEVGRLARLFGIAQAVLW